MIGARESRVGLVLSTTTDWPAARASCSICCWRASRLRVLVIKSLLICTCVAAKWLRYHVDLPEPCTPTKITSSTLVLCKVVGRYIKKFGRIGFALGPSEERGFA